jgi:hypothetical protein
MLKLSVICLLLLSSLDALGQQTPSLETFASPDGAFQFLYPESYQLLVGERILKATQGRHAGIPVCDFSTALVCVIYPVERLESPRFEAAGFSVDAVPAVTAEQACLAYTGRVQPARGEQTQPSSFRINGRVFRYVSTRRAAPGHLQSAHLYRTFQKERCYEMRIAVSLSDGSISEESVSGESAAPPSSSSKSPEDPAADNARESLKLILSSVVFK